MIGSLLGGISAGSSVIFAGSLSGAQPVLYSAAAAIAVVGGVASAIYGAKKKAELEGARGALEVSAAAASAWKEEREAEKAKAERLEEQLREETSLRKAAEARTNIKQVEALLIDQHREALAILAAVKDTLQILAARP